MKEQNSLLTAIKANKFKETKKLLNDHGLILDHDFSDYKLLIEALKLGRTEIVKLLIENGCRVSCQQKTSVYNTPLYYAVNLNSLELVKILLAKGASIEDKDANKETSLIFAMKNKYFEIVDLMLTNYEIKDTNINNEDEVSHFHIAVMRNNTKLVKNFLQHGMKVDQVSQVKPSISQGYTPLHFAVECKSIETVKLLLSNNANFGLKNAKGWTPLHLAFYLKSCKENDEIINLILFAHLKVMVNPIDNNGISHFHIACSKSNLGVLKSFLKSGAGCNSCVFSHSIILPGYAPLHIAVEYNCKKTVQFLLDNKADVNKAIGIGITPLHVAVKSDNNMEIIKLLLRHNADVCATDTDKNTPIHKAFEVAQINEPNEMSQTRKAILNLLFSAHQGNLKNVSNKCGVSLFHIACAVSNDPQLIENFLKHNVNINACVKKNVIWTGYSALNIAVITGSLKVIQILLKNSTALKMVNSDEYSPLYWVCKHWFDDALKAIAFSTAESPKKTLKDENFKADVLNRLRSIDENRFQIFKLFLERKEMYDSVIFDLCEMINLLQREALNSQDGMFELKRKQLSSIFKTIMINLIDRGYDINKKNKRNESILHCLIQHLRICYSPFIIEIIELLLIRGAQVDIEGENYVTPLMAAASDGFYEVVNILLKYKANPNKYSKDHDTPLHFALANKNIRTAQIANCISKVADLLLSKGAKVDVQNSYNYTPLHYAAKFTCLHKVLLGLLQRDCKVDSKNIIGDTALHIACFNHNLQGVITLLDYGADINLVNNGNWSPLNLVFIPPETLELFAPESFEIIFEMLKILELHIIKLNWIGFKVSKNNKDACNEIKNFCKLLNQGLVGLQLTEEDFTTADENNIYTDFCERELSRMKNVKIDTYTSLYSIIIKDAHEVSKNVNNENFKEFLNLREVKEKFPLYGYILKLQYKKGLKRYTLLKPAKEVLQSLLIDLPDLCYDRILAYFTNQELKRLTDQWIS